MHRNTLIKFAVVALAAGYCGSILPHTSALSGSSAARPGPTDAILAVHDSPRSAATLRVLTEPAAGIGPIVYVNSDLRYQEVTASTGGYSHTTQTNAVGSALIFLNGPPPGATITVKVGSATCTTRD